MCIRDRLRYSKRRVWEWGYIIRYDNRLVREYRVKLCVTKASAAGALGVTVCLPEARHLALQSSGMTLKVYALLFRGNLPHLGNPADQSDRRS